MREEKPSLTLSLTNHLSNGGRNANRGTIFVPIEDTRSLLKVLPIGTERFKIKGEKTKGELIQKDSGKSGGKEIFPLFSKTHLYLLRDAYFVYVQGEKKGLSSARRTIRRKKGRLSRT